MKLTQQCRQTFDLVRTERQIVVTNEPVLHAKPIKSRIAEQPPCEAKMRPSPGVAAIKSDGCFQTFCGTVRLARLER